MPELPTGTVTFLFTDIEASTRLLHEHGDRYAELLAEHRRVLRDAFARHGGVEVDTQGDAFFVAFGRASDALAAARDAQSGLGEGPINVRMGLHTGEPTATDEGYVGLDVHRAARIAAAGYGGQVLVSQATRDLADDEDLRDLGAHRLKDLSVPERLYQLGDGDFPPLRTLYQTNLPVTATPFLGREHELSDVLELLLQRDVRLLTLSGPGGTGKTRLALQAAAAAADSFPDGVYWVPLAALRDPELVLDAAAQAVRAPDGLADHITDKTLLLLFDNFEHLVAAAENLSELLAACPNVRLLVTSRELLRLPGEQAYAVPPLEPRDGVELFITRARAARPDFEPDDSVPPLCARLEQLPLALELAAARVRVLSPAQLLDRLSGRLDLLKAGRGADPRQQTLRATIEWSYDLLDPHEQRLLARLAVFRGGCTLDAAEDVCDADVEGLQALVDKSLVRLRAGRFVMLETIREYAAERLEASGEAAEVRSRHAHHFLRVAESANLNSGKLRPGGQRHSIAIAEQDNIRGALTWAVDTGSARLGLELATAMESFWVTQDPREGMRWFARLLEPSADDDVDAATRAHALRAYGSSTDIAGHDAAAERLYAQSLELFDGIGDAHGRAVLLHRLGIQAVRRGELDRARELVETSHAIHERNEERHAAAWGLAQTTAALGAIARDSGDIERARELVAQSVPLAREAGMRWWEAGMCAEQAALALSAGLLDEAEVHARDSLELVQDSRDHGGRVFCVGVLACVAAERGQLERAGRLWGAIEEEDAGAPLGGWRRHRAACEARVRAVAGPDFERGRAAGRDLSLDAAVEYALSLD